MIFGELCIPEMVRNLLILAGDTDSNVGDLAIITATCDEIRRIDKTVKISIVSDCPQRDRSRLGIVPLARGWRGLGGLIRAARRADLTICGGGGLFQDDDSLIKMPYWACRLLALRLFCKRFVGLSIGAGPLNHASSRLFARIALATMSSVTVRDARASSVIAPLTSKRVQVVPDPAFMLRSADQSRATAALQAANVPDDGSPLIGVALRRWFHTRSNIIPHKHAVKYGLRRIGGDREMAVYVRHVALLLDRMVREHDAHIVFMPSYDVPHENDSGICHRVADHMQSSSHSIVELDDPRVYKAVTSRFAAMLCGRMHPAILAASQGVPTIGIAYNPKFDGMYDLIGQNDHCLPIEDFLKPAIVDLAGDMLSAAIVGPRPDRDRVAELAMQTQACLRGLLQVGDFDPDSATARDIAA